MNQNQIANNLLNKVKGMNNPIVQNAVKLYQSNDTKSLQEMAQNLCNSKGLSVEDIKNRINQMCGF